MASLRDRIPWAAVLVVLVVALLVWGAVTEYRVRTELLASMEEELARADRAEARLAVLLELKERAPELEKSIQLMELLMPQSAGEPQLIQLVQGASDYAGMMLVSISFGGQVGGTGYVEVPVSIELQGTYAQLVGFVARLEAGPRAFRVDDVSLSPNPNGLGRLSILIRGSGFYAGR